MERAHHEWKILSSANLYTNQTGSFLSPAKVLGDIGIDTLKAENAAGVTEFFILGHGAENRVVRTFFAGDGTESREVLFTFEQIVYNRKLHTVFVYQEKMHINLV